MVSTLQKSTRIFTLYIRNHVFDMEKAKVSCEEAEQLDIPMYLIAPRGTDVTPLLHFSWRPDGIFLYDPDSPSDITNISQKINADRKMIDAINNLR